MLTASPTPPNLISKQLQMRAQSDLEQARFYKATQQFEMALASYDQARVTFKHAKNARQAIPLTELKSAFSQAQTPQTPEDESLRRCIAEVYVERAEALISLGKTEKARKSYEKAKKWGYAGVPAVSTPASLSTVDSGVGLAQSTEFFSSKISLAPPPKGTEACPLEKHQWVAQTFETILKQFQDLDLCQSSPSLFLVYAHNNRLGQADADISQRVIQWLSNLRSNLYSDRSASGHQALPFKATLEENAQANDILSSQLCLLPNHQGTVDHVVLCGSELLGKYMASPYYQQFFEAIAQAYQHASKANDFAQIEAALRQVVDANLKEPEFHHVLTELAFLQIREAHLKGEHGIIPMLLNSPAEQCLPPFILNSTTIRIEESRWRTPSNWKGQTYQDEGLHIGFFKLLKRLFVKQERCVALIEKKIYQNCLQQLREDKSHTLTAQAFSRFLNQACVSALDSLKQEHGADLRELNVQKAYESLRAEIKQIKGELQIAPDQLRLAIETSYSAKNLAIQRLSGPPLSMEHCYINLAVVEIEKDRAREEEEKVNKEKEKQLQEENTKKFKEERAKKSKEGKTKKGNEEEAKVKEEELKRFLAEAMQNHFYRLPSFEAINSNPQKLVPVENLFDPRELSKDKIMPPKRILIRGRAGVGKTTLSKKIVYEYTQKGRWRDRFDYLLWIPLRTLKGKSNCDLVTLFHEIYFQSQPEGQSLAKTLAAQVNGVAKDKTLFVLDGWDEVAQEWDEHNPMSGFLKQLLNQPAVLVTSRPYVDLKQTNPMDLELETVGFSPENVTAYLDNSNIVSAVDAEEMKYFIQTNAFIHELINVPIQLDALCYSWDEIKQAQQETSGAKTVTSLYQAMMNKLWLKDMLRLGKRKGDQLLTSSYVSTLESSSRIEKLVKVEHDFLSALALRGLQHNQIEFGHRDLHKLIELFEAQGVDLPVTLEENLKKLSFLHTNDTDEAQRSYHFMHLTFQEFFAAKFLVHHLQAHANTIRKTSPEQIEEIDIQLGVKPSLEEIESFIAVYKYNPRYEIVWWMVAGLLKGAALERFFMLLDDAPRDLIGIRHQQLMMGCLNEARSQLKTATINKLEKELMQWLDFEVKHEKNDRNCLCYQRIFPEHLLIKRLNQTNAEEKKKVIATLKARPALSDEAVSAFISVLKDKDEGVRSAAASALSSQSELSSDIVLALSSALKDKEWSVKYAITSTLGYRNTPTPEVVSIFTSALTDEDGYLRLEAVSTLGRLSTLSPDVVLALSSALKDKEWSVRLTAAKALNGQSTLPPEVLLTLSSALKDKEKSVRLAAASVLRSQRSLSPEAISALCSALRDEEAAVRLAVVGALGSQNRLPLEAVSALLSALKGKDSDVRVEAAKSLGNQSTLPSETVLALSLALKDEEWSVGLAAAGALASHCARSPGAVWALIIALEDQDECVRLVAAKALSSQGALPSKAVSALLSALQDEDSDIQILAARALGCQSELSSEAISALFSALHDKNWEVRHGAMNALGNQRILPAEAVLTLLSILRGGDEDLSSGAMRALGHQSVLPPEAVVAVLSALKDERWAVRFEAEDALRGHRELSSDAILALLSALEDEDKNLRLNAINALCRQTTLPSEAISVLSSALKDKDWELRYEVVSALGNRTKLPSEVVLALSSALENEEWIVHRYSVVRALGCQSKLPSEAILALLAALKDESKDVRSEALNVLGNQSTLPSEALLALSVALKDKEWAVKYAAVNALGYQSALPPEVILALLSALEDEGIRAAASRVLHLNLSRLFTLFPRVKRSQVKRLYTEVLLPCSVEQTTPLYIQNNQLHFYTAMGPGQPIKLNANQSKEIIEAFRSVQAKAGITSGLKKREFW